MLANIGANMNDVNCRQVHQWIVSAGLRWRFNEPAKMLWIGPNYVADTGRDLPNFSGVSFSQFDEHSPVPPFDALKGLEKLWFRGCTLQFMMRAITVVRDDVAEIVVVDGKAFEHSLNLGFCSNLYAFGSSLTTLRREVSPCTLPTHTMAVLLHIDDQVTTDDKVLVERFIAKTAARARDFTIIFDTSPTIETDCITDAIVNGLTRNGHIIALGVRNSDVAGHDVVATAFARAVQRGNRSLRSISIPKPITASVLRAARCAMRANNECTLNELGEWRQKCVASVYGALVKPAKRKRTNENQ